jgi:hypothetical protein
MLKHRGFSDQAVSRTPTAIERRRCINERNIQTESTPVLAKEFFARQTDTRFSPQFAGTIRSMLASATLHYSSDFNMQLLLIGIGVIAAAAVIGFVPIQLARMANHRRFDLICTAVVLWTAVSAASVCWFIVRQYQFSTSQQQSLLEGYYDPQDQSDKPQAPIVLWSAMGGCYGLLIWWSRR